MAPAPRLLLQCSGDLFVCFREEKKKDFRKMLFFFFLTWGHVHPSHGVSDGVGMCSNAVRQRCSSHCTLPLLLLLCSLHPSSHAILQPAPLQRCQLEPISARATCQCGQWRGCSGNPWSAAVYILPLGEGLVCCLPALFPLINIQDNDVCQKTFRLAHNVPNWAEMKHVLISSSPPCWKAKAPRVPSWEN